MDETTLHILSIAGALYIAYFAWNVWLLKKFGELSSPIFRSLSKFGYDSTFGFIAAAIYPLLVIGTCFGFHYLKEISIGFFGLAIGTIGIYAVLVVLLNIFGKRYLFSRGINPVPKNGYKGFVQNYKDALAKAKEKQRKKKEESLF